MGAENHFIHVMAQPLMVSIGLKMTKYERRQQYEDKRQERDPFLRFFLKKRAKYNDVDKSNITITEKIESSK